MHILGIGSELVKIWDGISLLVQAGLMPLSPENVKAEPLDKLSNSNRKNHHRWQKQQKNRRCKNIVGAQLLQFSKLPEL